MQARIQKWIERQAARQLYAQLARFEESLANDRSEVFDLLYSGIEIDLKALKRKLCNSARKGLESRYGSSTFSGQKARSTKPADPHKKARSA